MKPTDALKEMRTLLMNRVADLQSEINQLRNEIDDKIGSAVRDFKARTPSGDSAEGTRKKR